MSKHETSFRKGSNGWTAKTEIVLEGVTKPNHKGEEKQGILTISTAKSSAGFLYTNASVAFRDGMFMTHALYQDFSVTVDKQEGVRCTEKAIEKLHDSAMARVDEIINLAKAHYATEPA